MQSYTFQVNNQINFKIFLFFFLYFCYMLDVYIKNIKSDDLPQWGDISIKLNYDGQIQPQIEIDAFDFVNNSAQQIIKHIDGGLNGTTTGIFEGLPLKIDLPKVGNIFDGYIDLTDDFEVLHNSKVRAKLKTVNINNIKDLLSGVTCEYLTQKGYITKKDYQTHLEVVEKELDLVTLGQLIITIYLLKKELKTLAKEIKDEYAEFSALFTSSISSSVSAIAMKAIKLAIKVAYFVFLVIEITILVKNLLGYFIQVPKKQRCISIEKLLKGFLKSVGYALNTSLPLNSYYISPTNGYENDPTKIVNRLVRKRIKQGVPSSFDYGYIGDEVIDLVEKLFNAKFVVVGNVVECHNMDSPFWQKNSSYVKPDVLSENIKYNTNELNNTFMIRYETDLQDTFTISNYKGTIYEVITEHKQQPSNPKFSRIKNFEEVKIPFALPNRKNENNEVEVLCLELAKATDKLVKFLGGSSNFVSKIERYLGALKISNDYKGKAKLLYLKSNGSIPQNHREFLDAKYIYNTFYKNKTFVNSNYYGQEIIKSERVPFTLLDYNKIKNNRWFKTEKGELAYFEEAEWFPNRDYALIKYRVKKPYTKNLKQTTYEPE